MIDIDLDALEARIDRIPDSDALLVEKTEARALIARIRETEDENRRLTLQAAESEHARRLAFEAKDRANAERAEAEATIDAVSANLSNAPECDEHPDDGPITCGWKSDMIRVRAAIARHQDKRENGRRD